MKVLMFFIMIFIGSCGTEYRNERTPRNPELENLKKTVLQLQGTVAQLDAFTASDFSDCSSRLPPFETKICQIAQTSTAEQRVLFSSQLAQASKIFQNELYGEDCINDTDVGCPISGSITDQIQQVNTNTISLGALQGQVASLQNDVVLINNRLNNFNGSGQSIELIIEDLATNIANLESRVDVIEDSINSNKVFQSIAVCGDIPSSGPLYEVLLLSGDHSSVTAYLESGSRSGLARLQETGDGQGDLLYSTTLNTRKCNFKIYDLGSELRLCWNNSNRLSNENSINNECDSSNNFLNPTANCTCY